MAGADLGAQAVEGADQRLDARGESAFGVLGQRRDARAQRFGRGAQCREIERLAVAGVPLQGRHQLGEVAELDFAGFDIGHEVSFAARAALAR